MFSEDLSAFFNADELATVARWFAGGTGVGVEVSGIWVDRFASPSLGALQAVDREISFRCAAADVDGVARGDTLRVDSVTYRVVEPRPDADGTVTLILRVTP